MVPAGALAHVIVLLCAYGHPVPTVNSHSTNGREAVIRRRGPRPGHWRSPGSHRAAGRRHPSQGAVPCPKSEALVRPWAHEIVEALRNSASCTWARHSVPNAAWRGGGTHNARGARCEVLRSRHQNPGSLLTDDTGFRSPPTPHPKPKQTQPKASKPPARSRAESATLTGLGARRQRRGELEQAWPYIKGIGMRPDGEARPPGTHHPPEARSLCGAAGPLRGAVSEWEPERGPEGALRHEQGRSHWPPSHRRGQTLNRATSYLSTKGGARPGVKRQTPVE